MLTDVSEDLDLSYLSKIDMGVGSCSLGRSRWRHMTDRGASAGTVTRECAMADLGAKYVVDVGSRSHRCGELYGRMLFAWIGML